MKLLKKILPVLSGFLIQLLLFTAPTLADIGISITPKPVDENTPKATIQFNNLVPGTKYYFSTIQDGSGNRKTLTEPIKATSTTISFDVCGAEHNFLKTACGDNGWFSGNKKYTAVISVEEGGSLKELGRAEILVEPFNPDISFNSDPADKRQFILIIKGSRRPANNSNRNKYTFDLSGKAPDGTSLSTSNPAPLVVTASGEADRKVGPLQNGDYTLKVKYSGDVIATYSINVTDAGGTIGGGATGGGSGGSGPPGRNPCPGGVCQTAIGDIPTNPTAFAGQVLTFGIGIAGGIALIIMVIGSIKILASSGDPKKVGEGREMIIAAVAGLLFLILSVLILRFIGATFLPTNPFT